MGSHEVDENATNWDSSAGCCCQWTLRDMRVQKAFIAVELLWGSSALLVLISAEGMQRDTIELISVVRIAALLLLLTAIVKISSQGCTNAMKVILDYPHYFSVFSNLLVEAQQNLFLDSVARSASLIRLVRLLRVVMAALLLYCSFKKLKYQHWLGPDPEENDRLAAAKEVQMEGSTDRLAPAE
eukprot:gnl/TRDRNA2_/TRDRNA2_204660_c0_seq1.p1 gnl/TRDRNA2_/TRDRNA2_204660_c0~~gnl/TRDRNA2_/TRDRNA2_204660_c0_seq1.p1  ORF type:complete len:184 (+),score=40.13 gnl/TRDRNA2_/TRDRNA2_204660_c0_seq1:33-584(+)